MKCTKYVILLLRKLSVLRSWLGVGVIVSQVVVNFVKRKFVRGSARLVMEVKIFETNEPWLWFGLPVVALITPTDKVDYGFINNFLYLATLFYDIVNNKTLNGAINLYEA